MKRRTRLLLSIISAILLSLAWLGFPGWVLFVAFLPLLLIEQFFVDQKSKYKSVSFFLYALLTFFIWNIVTTYWVMHASLAGMMVAVFLNSIFMSAVWWLAHIVRRNLSGKMSYFALAIFWLSFEYLHFNWEIEWPWLTLGHGFANNIKMIQWYEFTGVLGGSLWVLLINFALFKLLNKIVLLKSKRLIIKASVNVILLIIVPLFFSIVIFRNYEEFKNPKNIVIVQPNIDPYSESFTQEASDEKLLKFIKLGESMIDDSTDFVVGPETLIEQEWKEDRITSYKQYHYLVSMVQKSNNLGLVFGASTYKIYKKGEKLSETVRTSTDGTKFDGYNTALFLNGKGELQTYHKSVLVPGVEKMPFVKHLGFLKKFIIDLGGSAGSYGTQPERTNFVADDGTKIAPVICYESVFGEYLSEYVKKGASLIFIITNDGWWKNTPGYKQHMSFSRLRAIETRRSIARAANTGISCFINQKGEVFQKTQWWAEAVIKGQINTNNKLTFYVNYGDFIGRLSAFLSVLILLLLVVTRLKR